MNTEATFAEIRNKYSDEYYSTENSILVQGDSLELLKKIPDHSVALILTDPPYHSTKKRNIIGDTNFSKDSEYIEWMRKYAIEWKRVLKHNGSIFCFCSSTMSAQLQVMFSAYFNVLSEIVWTKPNAPGYDGWKQKMKKKLSVNGILIRNASFFLKMPRRGIYSKVILAGGLLPGEKALI